MKTQMLITLTGLFLWAGGTLSAQTSNLVFYCNEGERFYVILNGIRQNPDPETNVKITGCDQPYYKVKLIFENPNLLPLEKNLSFNPGTETVFAVKKNNKGEWVIRWQSETPIASIPPPPTDQHICVYTTTPATTTTVTTTTTTVTGTGITPPPTGGVSIDINAGEQGFGVNMNVGTTQGVHTHETTTMTYSTTTTSGNTGINTPAETVYILPGYNGPTGCPRPMNDNDFSGVKQSVSSKSFEDSKLQIAKQVTSSNCLLSSQVKEIMLLFTFENTRLDFAKYAYSYTFDTGNYYKVNDAFSFESSIDELNEYIQAVRK
ncbi:MAG: DUF4476 domain-containing protein [Bacteroidetes bacterium]|nr:DUF4476 domain-containing protein [Bacteroidota bacterium]